MQMFAINKKEDELKNPSLEVERNEAESRHLKNHAGWKIIWVPSWQLFPCTSTKPEIQWVGLLDVRSHHIKWI